MWVLYRNEQNGKEKKFNVSSPNPSILTNNYGDWFLVENPKPKMKLIGYAILIKDDISGMKMWATFNGDGEAHTNLSPQQPLVFPTHGNIQLGTRIDWLVPEE